jgi:hypothetical protein
MAIAAVFLLPGTAMGADPPEALPRVVVSGGESELHIMPPLKLTFLSLLPGQTEACTDFTVSALSDEAKNIVVMSLGFGDGLFADPHAPAKRKAIWPLPIVTAAGSRLRLCLPARLVPSAGDSVSGKILILTPDRKPIEVPMKLSRPSSDPPSSALLWFVALLIPALLTYGVASVTAYRTNRNKQLARFGKYQDLAYSELKMFFGTHWENLQHADPNSPSFEVALEDALREYRIWSRIPDKERESLRKLLRCRSASKEQIARLLATQFPDWKEKIDPTGK